MNIRVLRLGRDESVEIDTPNQAFSILRPGSTASRQRRRELHDGDRPRWRGRSDRRWRTYASVPARAVTSGARHASCRIYRADGYDEFDRWCQAATVEMTDRNRCVMFLPIWSAIRTGRLRHLVRRRDYGNVWMTTSSEGLGALSRWPLGMDFAVGLDVGR